MEQDLKNILGEAKGEKLCNSGEELGSEKQKQGRRRRQREESERELLLLSRRRSTRCIYVVLHSASCAFDSQ